MREKILIVEDYELLSTNLKLMLQKRGFSIAGVAQTGEEAISLIEIDKPDVVVMDIKLHGDLDGIETAKIILKRWNLPVIYLTSHEDEEFLSRALKTAAYGYLLKNDNLKIQLPIMIEFALYKRAAEQKMRKIETNYKQLFKDSPVGIYKSNFEGKILECNPAFARMFGYDSPEEIIENTKDLREEFFVNPEDRDFLILHLKKSAGYAEREIKLKKKDGENFCANLKVKIIHDSGLNQRILFGLIEDVSNRKKAEQELKASEEKFRAIVSSAKDAIVFTDSQARIKYWNDAATRIFGFNYDEVIDKKLHEIIIPNYHSDSFADNIVRFCEESANKNVDREFETEALKKSGDTLPVEMSISSANLNGQRHVCAIIRDITDRVKAEEDMRQLIDELTFSRDAIEESANKNILLSFQLKESEEKLREMNAAKDKFFSIIAHDLKNPFMGLLGNSKILSSNIDALSKEDVNEIAADLHESAESVFKLLENLLHWSRLQRDAVEFNPDDFLLKDVVDVNLGLVKMMADNKKVKLKNSVDSKAAARADINMVNTALRNLITNAIKFTPEGGEIEIFTQARGGSVTVSVRDNGVGMSEEDKAKLFRIDQRHTSAGTNNEQGTGLGLTLCKELIEKNDGEIWVESALGKGSTFSFSLPAAENLDLSGE